MSTVSSSRRTKKQMDLIKDAMVEAIRKDKPMTVRQVFYRLVSEGVIDKTEQEYKGTVVRLLADLRREGRVPFGDIADSTRWVRRPKSSDGLEDFLDDSISLYRRNMWQDIDAYVEIWLEKEALAGVLWRSTSKWNVPLMVTRGYASLSYLHGAGEAIREQGKPAYLYYFGDYDPSGCDITRQVEEGVREFGGDCEIHFERVAVTNQQILDLKLPTRPTKKTDSRSKGFDGESVEVDAIPPVDLRKLCEDCITQHIDEDSLRQHREQERMEKETLKRFRESFDLDDDDDDE